MTTDSPAVRYRRRRRWPILLVTAILLAATGVIWFQALKPAEALPSGCNTPGPAPTTQTQTSRTKTTRTTTYAGGPTSSSEAASTSSSATPTIATTLGQLTDKNTLASVRPASPATISLKVFNASQQRGMAKTLSDELRTVGFASITDVANDPLYPAGDLRCVGEIRYGPAGVAGARTVLIMMPCAQLVVDNRVDDSVDLAIGARYVFADTPAKTKAELTAISQGATPPAVIDGRTLAVRSPMPIPPLPTAACPD